ncbi:hypothetical protein A2Y85_00160 [candidate division WOR-3 bacterium RBG_13_43_14]|uniref:Guanylate cyclase domain-containing protein n=1 Tax=candidate division WOR-3 bacterium RBG_13_43_14 TaxID=1802590 RepID=A0A1F4UD69_UNCW3|nr:MAG: hypothetical protein A2Y85_00160 [candidate division WOR-3 bacterium RBG_13_43_14]
MKNRLFAAFIITVAATILVNAVCLYRPLYEPFERRIYDLKYALVLKNNKIENIVVVDIDEASLVKLGRYQNWPRVYFAQILQSLSKAKVVGFDVFFGEPDTLPVEARKFYSKPSFDTLMEDMIADHGRVVLVSSISGLPVFTLHNKIGVGEILADFDGVVRRGYSEIEGIPAFASVIAADYILEKTPPAKFFINFYPESSFRKISYSDVYFHRVPVEFFENKIVLVGGTAPGLFDRHAVPFDRNYPGLLIQANLVNTLVTGSWINEVPYCYCLLATFLIALLFAVFTLYRSWWFYLPAGLIISSLFMVAITFMFARGWEFGMVRPFYVFILTLIFGLGYRYQFEEREKRKIRSVFSRYYSRELVDKLIKHTPQLGGEKVDCTIIFADIRNFTPYAEQSDPQRVEDSLNRFLDAMVQIVFKYQGRIDKFIGDCVMAVFGSPMTVPNHALNACFAALEMIKRAEELGFKIGIGINSGEVISGNFGSLMRMEYTVIGDAVNLAARLETATKELNQSIVLGKATHERASRSKIMTLEFIELGSVKVKGKEEPQPVYTLRRVGENVSA